MKYEYRAIAKVIRRERALKDRPVSILCVQGVGDILVSKVGMEMSLTHWVEFPGFRALHFLRSLSPE